MKAAQKKEQQEWAIEKPKLENARNLKGIHSIDPKDEEYNYIIKNTRKKLEIPMAHPMPCRRSQSSSVTGAVNLKIARAPEKIQKMKFDCIVEAHESKRPRMESVKKRNHEDHIVGKGYNSISHYNVVHKFILMPQVMKIPDAKAAADKEWKKLETFPAWQLEKVRSKKEVVKEVEK